MDLVEKEGYDLEKIIVRHAFQKSRASVPC